MRWTERQRAMLAEMGLRPWFRDEGEIATDDGPPGGSAIAATTPVSRTGAPTAARAEPGPAIAPARPAAPAATAAPAAPVAPAAPSARSTPAPGHAGWLVIGAPPEPADTASLAAVEAEQDGLLANMLRAIGVSQEAVDPAARSVLVRAGTPAMQDLDLLRAQVQPRCVLALGRPAATALLGIDEPLGRLRGRAHAWHGVPVVVTFALAYLLRNPGEKAKAWLDLCLAVGTADADAIADPPPQP